MKTTKSFRTCANKGFQITLPNGVTISTQFGGGNYSDNYSDEIEVVAQHDKQANTVEFAAFDVSGDWITRKLMRSIRMSCNDDVVGRIEIKQWLRLLDAARRYKG